MAYLFKIENKKVFPNPETLLIEPFKTIWERDKTKNKENAIEELSYIEFIGSVKKSNPFRQYAVTIKEEKVREAVITRIDWQPDELVLNGIKKLEEFQKEASTTYQYYKSAKEAAEKMQVFFNTFDINERNPKTLNPIYKPRDITSALNDTAKTLENLKALEKKVEEELYESSKKKAGKKISHFATRDSLR